MSDVKVQINSEAALMRLLGGDEKLQMEVRDSIANNFITAHIKPLLNDDRYNRFSNDILAKIEKAKEEAVKDIVYTIQRDWRGNGSQTLSDTLRADIRDAVTKHVEALVTKAEQDCYKKLKERVDELFDKNKDAIETYIENKLVKAMNDTISVRLKEVTGHLSELSAFYAAQLKEHKKDERNIQLVL